MKSMVGLWKIYRPNELYAILGELIRDVTKERKKLTSDLSGEKPIHSVDELYQVMQQYEEHEGTHALVNLLLFFMAIMLMKFSTIY